MLAGLISWICLCVFIFGGLNPMYLIASGIFAIASNVKK